MERFKSKFTPGPWELIEDDRNYGRVIRDKDRNVVCVPADMKPVPEIECYANAQLIASAPELLEALQSLMETYDTDKHLLNFNVDIARQAINKALGIQPTT